MAEPLPRIPKFRRKGDDKKKAPLWTTVQFSDYIEAVKTGSRDALKSEEGEAFCSILSELLNPSSLLLFFLEKVIEHKQIKHVSSLLVDLLLYTGHSLSTRSPSPSFSSSSPSRPPPSYTPPRLTPPRPASPTPLTLSPPPTLTPNLSPSPRRPPPSLSSVSSSPTPPHLSSPHPNSLFHSHVLSLARRTVRTAFDGVTLMRTDSICTMLMTKYAIDVIEKDSHFLNKTVGGVTRELVKERSGGGGEEEKKESVLKVAEMYSDAIFGCPEDVPEPLRVIARVLKEEVNEKGLGDGRSAIGGFLLLRYIVPAIVNPALFDSNLVIPANLKEDLLMASKLMQNLSNRTFPRAENLLYTKPFLEKKQDMVTEYLLNVSNIGHMDCGWEGEVGGGGEGREEKAVKALQELGELVVEKGQKMKEMIDEDGDYFTDKEKLAFVKFLNFVTKKIQISKVKVSPKVKLRNSFTMDGTEEETLQAVKHHLSSPSSPLLYLINKKLSKNAVNDKIYAILGVIKLAGDPLLVLLKLVELGMGECGNIGEVFRLDTLMTSLLVKFAHEVVEPEYKYLSKSIGELAIQIDKEEKEREEKEGGEGGGEEREKRLLEVGGRFVEGVFGGGGASVPLPLRQICYVISEEAKKKNVDPKNIVAGFILLRVIVPCILRPSTVIPSINLSKNTQTDLLTISKLLHNLSTGITPRSSNMAFALPFLEEKQPFVVQFLEQVTNLTEKEKPKIEKTIPPPPPKIGDAEAAEVLKLLIEHRESLLEAIEEEGLNVEFMETKAFLKSIKGKNSKKNSDKKIEKKSRTPPVKKKRPISSLIPSQSLLPPSATFSTSISPCRSRPSDKNSLKPERQEEESKKENSPSSPSTSFPFFPSFTSPPSWKTLLSSSLSVSFALCEHFSLPHPLSILFSIAEGVKRGEWGEGRGARVLLELVEKSWPEEAKDEELKGFSYANCMTSITLILETSPEPLLLPSSLSLLQHSNLAVTPTSISSPSSFPPRRPYFRSISPASPNPSPSSNPSPNLSPSPNSSPSLSQAQNGPPKFIFSPKNMAEIAKAFPVANFRVLMELFPLLNSDLDRFGSVVLDHPALTLEEDEITFVKQLIRMFC